MPRRTLLALCLATVAALPAMAQSTAAPVHVHTPGMQHPAAAQPTEPGQDAFGTISEIVKILDADPMTDWSRVDLEALRQHLKDMNAVTLRSSVRRTQVAGGLSMEVTGDAATAQAIQRMITNHAGMLDGMPEYAARAKMIPGGVRFVVTAEQPADSQAVTRIRGLGFIGLMTLGEHHTAHHLMIARGESVHGH